MSTDIRTRITDYLARFLPVDDLADDDDIFQRGFVSSMFAMQLVAFVEQEFGITVENDDLELSNFRSVAALERFVGGKVTALAA